LEEGPNCRLLYTGSKYTLYITGRERWEATSLERVVPAEYDDVGYTVMSY